MAAFFSEEMFIEILKHLPVKSLLRLRCVKKSWYYLIHSSYFKNLHFHQQKSRDKYLLFSSPYENRSYSLRFDDKQCEQYCTLRFPGNVRGNLLLSPQKIYGTSNGLVCLSDSITVVLVHLWNPVIGKVKTLPYDSPCYHYGMPQVTGLAFGYSAKSSDYKVIKITEYRQSRHVDVRVYSLSTNSWKTVGKHNDFARYSYSFNSVVANGATYWVVGVKDYPEKKVMACFDMDNEISREIMLPHYSNNSETLLQKCCELLCLFYCNMSTNIIDMWELEKQGEMNESWTKKITLDLNRLDGRWWPSGFRNNGEIILTNKDEFGYISYNLEKNKAAEFVDSLDLWSYRSVQYRFDPTNVYLFEENLVLLDEDQITYKLIAETESL